MNLKEWPFILIGVIASIIMGSIGPIFALLFGDVLNLLSWQDIEAARLKSFEYSMMFLILGLTSGVAMFLQVFCDTFRHLLFWFAKGIDVGNFWRKSNNAFEEESI